MARAIALVVACALLIASSVGPAHAAAKGKGKKRPPARTVTTETLVAAGAVGSATSVCPRGTHLTGGGHSLAPPFSANGTVPRSDDTGAGSVTLGSNPLVDFTGWTASLGLFTFSPSAGTLTSAVRCERNALGRLVDLLIGTNDLAGGSLGVVRLVCGPGTHMLSGGFAVEPPGDLSDPTAVRPIILSSARVDERSWEVTAHYDGPTPAVLRGFGLCERNGHRRTVSERSTTVPVVDLGRTSAEARCPKGRHSVAGGFAIVDATPTTAIVGVDHSLPVGVRGWNVSLHENPTYNLPVGTTLTTHAYCKRNPLPLRK